MGKLLHFLRGGAFVEAVVSKGEHASQPLEVSRRDTAQTDINQESATSTRSVTPTHSRAGLIHRPDVRQSDEDSPAIANLPPFR